MLIVHSVNVTCCLFFPSILLSLSYFDISLTNMFTQLTSFELSHSLNFGKCNLLKFIATIQLPLFTELGFFSPINRKIGGQM